MASKIDPNWGKGLGPTKNSTDCDHCKGKGYNEHNDIAYTQCKTCNGKGMSYSRIVSCRPCQGTGNFTQANSKRVVTCKACKGSGTFQQRLWTPITCSVCQGNGGYAYDTEKKLYTECDWCSGTGQVEIYNPVSPKARLMVREA